MAKTTNSNYVRRRFFFGWFHTGLLAIVLLFSASEGIAQTLWGGTHYGMSPKEVIQKVQGAKRVDNGDNIKDYKELVRLEGIEIVEKIFDASFYFKNEKLGRVILSLREGSGFITCLSVFEKITDALRSKYGEELSPIKKFSSNNLKSVRATWLSGKTSILVNVLQVGETPATFKIIYEVGISKEADKL